MRDHSFSGDNNSNQWILDVGVSSNGVKTVERHTLLLFYLLWYDADVHCCVFYTNIKSPSRMFHFSTKKTDLLSSRMLVMLPTEKRYHYGNKESDPLPATSEYRENWCMCEISHTLRTDNLRSSSVQPSRSSFNKNVQDQTKSLKLPLDIDRNKGFTLLTFLMRCLKICKIGLGSVWLMLFYKIKL